jgi:rubrerythrin
MSMSEILEELPKLKSEERQTLFERLEALEMDHLEETPEMLQAIDAGRQSLREEKTYSPEEARTLITRWTTKSS